MPAMTGFYDSLKSTAGKVFVFLASITLTGTDGKTITCTQDTSLDEAAAMSSKADKVTVRDPDQSVALTAGAGPPIIITDNANIKFGSRNLAFVWKGSLPDWSATVQIVHKNGGGNGYYLYQQASYFKTVIKGGEILVTTIPNTFVSNTVHEICVVADQTNSLLTYYVDGVKFGDSVAFTPSDTDNTTNISILGSGTVDRYAGTVHHAYTFNRALTAAEVLDLYRNGIAESDKWGSQTEATSGTLVIGKKYRINAFAASDDFVNVGGTNVTGNEFTATGTTPTNWAHGSSLVEIGATLALTSESWQSDKPYDCSSNNLTCAYPATGWSLTRSVKKPTIASGTGLCVFTAAQGPSGANTAIQGWTTFIDSAGVTRYMPYW